VSSEYDPIGGALRGPAGVEDFETVREKFAAAGQPFLASPLGWLAWAAILPAASLATGPVWARFGPAGVLFLWSSAILVGGLVEMLPLLRRGRREGRTLLATWALRVQGNLSLVGAALSAALLWHDQAGLLPALWLLLLGHSFYMLGGLAFPPFRACGLLYQGAGLLALWPRVPPLVVFAVATALGNGWIGWGIWRLRRANESA